MNQYEPNDASIEEDGCVGGADLLGGLNYHNYISTLTTELTFTNGMVRLGNPSYDFSDQVVIPENYMKQYGNLGIFLVIRIYLTW